jgi:hypothetical protein
MAVSSVSWERVVAAVVGMSRRYGARRRPRNTADRCVAGLRT